MCHITYHLSGINLCSLPVLPSQNTTKLLQIWKQVVAFAVTTIPCEEVPLNSQKKCRRFCLSHVGSMLRPDDYWGLTLSIMSVRYLHSAWTQVSTSIVHLCELGDGQRDFYLSSYSDEWMRTLSLPKNRKNTELNCYAS